MVERDAESLARGRANVEKVYDGLIAKNRMSAEAKAAVMARFTGSTATTRCAGRPRRRGRVRGHGGQEGRVRRARRVCKPGAVLATNTSYLDIDEIAASISRPAT
jgi:3-hydroxyacyl-CoA dehydrogenase